MVLSDSWKHFVAKPQWHWTLDLDIAWKGNMAKPLNVSPSWDLLRQRFREVEVTRKLF